MAKFFAKRETAKPVVHQVAAASSPTPDNNTADGDEIPLSWSQAIKSKLDDPEFCSKFELSKEPLGMLAVAMIAQERFNKNDRSFFDGLTFTVPPSDDMCSHPQCHSVVGQKLLLVDWKKQYGIEVKCPCCNAEKPLKTERTNFSKKRILFLVFGLGGPPMWCMVAKM